MSSGPLCPSVVQLRITATEKLSTLSYQVGSKSKLLAVKNEESFVNIKLLLAVEASLLENFDQ